MISADGRFDRTERGDAGHAKCRRQGRIGSVKDNRAGSIRKSHRHGAQRACAELVATGKAVLPSEETGVLAKAVWALQCLPPIS